MLYSRKYFPNRLSEILVTLSFILFCSCSIFLFLIYQAPRINLLINRPQWEISKPSTYRMEVVERTAHRGTCRWAIDVKDNTPVTFTLLHTTQPKRICWLNPKDINIEKIFNFADSCASDGLLDCQLEFDPQFHFPNYILDYPDVIIEVENFVSCEQDLSNCFLSKK